MKQRHFIRHPSSIPIDAQPIDSNDIDHTSMLDVSEGGLSFSSPTRLPAGIQLRIQIPSMDRSFCITGHVAWVEKEAKGYTIGVAFTDKDEAFLVRMVEQLCHIESYWQQKIKMGTKTTIEQAASEWIELFASEFPKPLPRRF